MREPCLNDQSTAGLLFQWKKIDTEILKSKIFQYYYAEWIGQKEFLKENLIHFIDNTREGAVQTNDRLRLVAGKVSVSYNTVKGALTGLHEKYESSKVERNVFRRYALLKGIVKEVIQLDAQYWLLLDVPKQDKQEQVNVYVLRACAVLEKASDTRPQGESSKSQAAQQAEEEAREKERKAKLEVATVQQIEEENTLLINDLYRLLKKYANLRQVVHTLHLSYRAARMYPIFPRYNMLKDMIKSVMRDPSYMEVCHEES